MDAIVNKLKSLKFYDKFIKQIKTELHLTLVIYSLSYKILY